MPLKDEEKRKSYQAKYLKEVWYPKNQKRHILSVKKLKKKVSDFIKDYKINGKCADCGLEGKKHPYILDFDHRGNKAFSIADFRRSVVSLSSVEKEIKKCDLVCANCHRIRTFKKIKIAG